MSRRKIFQNSFIYTERYQDRVERFRVGAGRKEGREKYNIF